MNSGEASVAARVMEHVERYRVSTSGLIAKDLGLRVDECASAVKADLEQGRLATEGEFFDDIIIGSNTGRRHRSSRNRNTSLATAFYCHAGNTQRQLLTGEELRSHFPDLYRPERDRRYVIDQEGEAAKLILLRIDCGGSGRWDRILDKSIRDVKRHLDDDAFNRLIQDQLFNVHVLTAFESKRRRLLESLSELSTPLAQCVRVFTQPELGHLLFLP